MLWLHGIYLSVIGVLGFQLWAKTVENKTIFTQIEQVSINTTKELSKESEHIYDIILNNVATNPTRYEVFQFKGKKIVEASNSAIKLINQNIFQIHKHESVDIEKLRVSLAFFLKELNTIDDKNDSLYLIQKFGLLKLIQNDTIWKGVQKKGIVYFELLKNQILLDKILYLNYISDKMSANDFRCNWRFKVAIAPRKSVLIEGEKFEADIFIVSYPIFGSHISYTVDDSELLVEDGVSSFSKIESGIGLKTHNAKATIKNPVTGESLTSNAEFQYHVLPKCSQNCQ